MTSRMRATPWSRSSPVWGIAPRRQNRALMGELQALRDVTDSALSALELPEMLRRLLQTVVGYMHATAGAVFLQSEREGTLEVAQSVGLNALEREQFHLRIGEG